MLSGMMRSDRREGESSSASQANSGLVIAIRMRASESKRRNGRYPYTATTPRLVRRLVEKTEKNSAQPILPRIDVFLGGTVFGRLDSDRKKWERRTPQRAADFAFTEACVTPPRYTKSSNRGGLALRARLIAHEARLLSPTRGGRAMSM